MLIIDKTIFIYRLNVASTGITTSVKYASTTTNSYRIYCSHVNSMYQVFCTVSLPLYILFVIQNNISARIKCYSNWPLNQFHSSQSSSYSLYIWINWTEGCVPKLISLYMGCAYTTSSYSWQEKRILCGQ